MNNQQLLQKMKIIKDFRKSTLSNDTLELQQKRKKFLDWLNIQEIQFPQVLEMYQGKDFTIYGKKQVPQYFKEYKFANTRTQLKSELRAECDKLPFPNAIDLICNICLELIKNNYHFAIFYAEGQRSPHVIIYDFYELQNLSPFQRLKAKIHFWRSLIPFRMQLLDLGILEDGHYVPLEFAIHWKYQTPFNLLFEYVPKELPLKKVIPKKKRVYKTPLKKKRRESFYHKSCVKCGSPAYLTEGGYFLCTNRECLYKEVKNAKLSN